MSPLSRWFFRTMVAAHVGLYRLTGGRFAGRRKADGGVVLLETTGARTGLTRTVPVMHLNHGDDLVVVASMGGASANPGWYHNLRANPDVEVQVGHKRSHYRAREAEGEERERLWQRVVDHDRRFATYQERTERRIPVMVLEPQSAT